MSDETTNEHPEDENVTGTPDDEQTPASASSDYDEYDEDDDEYEDDAEADDTAVATDDGPEEYDGPSVSYRLLRNGDFPASITAPEGTTGRELTKRLLETRDDNGNYILRGADPAKQTFLDDSGHAYGPNDVIPDGALLNSVAKLGGAVSTAPLKIEGGISTPVIMSLLW